MLNRNRPRVGHGEKEALPTSLAWTLGLLALGASSCGLAPFQGLLRDSHSHPSFLLPKGFWPHE